MTYSPQHVADDQRLTQLLDILDQELTTLRQMMGIYDDALTMPGRRPDVDPDETGRQATHGPSRPTEAIALDEARALMRTAVRTGVSYAARATACIRGAHAVMDRALSVWEGEPMGGHDGCNDGPAGNAGSAG